MAELEDALPLPKELARLVLSLVGDHVAGLVEDGRGLVVWHAQTFEFQKLRLEIAVKTGEVRISRAANELSFPMWPVELHLELPLKLSPLLHCRLTPGDLSWYSCTVDEDSDITVERLSQLAVAVLFRYMDHVHERHEVHFKSQPVVVSSLKDTYDSLLFIERSGACWSVCPTSGAIMPRGSLFPLEGSFRTSETLEGLCVATADSVAVLDFTTRQWNISKVKAPLVPDSIALLGSRVLGHHQDTLLELVGDTWTPRSQTSCGSSHLAFAVDVDLRP
jgi:hypothetical protein